MKKDASTSWKLPDTITSFERGEGRTDDDFKKRESLVSIIAQKGKQKGWTKAEMASRIGMAEATFSQWFNGKYNGRLDAQNEKVENFLAALKKMESLEVIMPKSPAFVDTKFSDEVMKMLAAAKVFNTMVMVTAEAGIGKTAAINQFLKLNANTFVITAGPHTKTAYNMLIALSDAMSIHENNVTKVVQTITRRLNRIDGGSLLIVDEAQNLSEEAVNQIRHFSDNPRCQCGLALVGNRESYTRFQSNLSSGKGSSQISSRFLRRQLNTKPYREDVETFIAAWGVADEEMKKYLLGIGMKEGALRSIDQTLQLATLYANGNGQELSIEHIKFAWKSRNVEVAA